MRENREGVCAWCRGGYSGRVCDRCRKITQAAFVTNLRRHRLRKDWSQVELAKFSGFIPSAIAHFESGRRMPSVHNLKRLCRALGVSAESLIGA